MQHQSLGRIIDADVKKALTAYGVICKLEKTNGQANVNARLNLRAGIAWFHTNLSSLGPALVKLLIAQSLILATALGLVFAISGSLDIWPTMVARRLVSRMPMPTHCRASMWTFRTLSQHTA